MNSLSTRINGQADYRSTTPARAAWREEMLDELLSQMRARAPKAEPVTPVREMLFTGKGQFVDLYV